jgi:chemosensory pili system protein ChpA (sensor histidine kinase/response regulator)
MPSSDIKARIWLYKCSQELANQPLIRKDLPMKLFGKFRRKDSQDKASPLSLEAEQTSKNKAKVLVVDDDPVVVKTLTLKLQTDGYTVISAGDGSDAVVQVRQEKPDLVILDLNFPPEVGMSWDGFKILEWFRRPREGAKIPVIIITGDDSAKNKERAAAVGAAAFFQKPINTEELLATIHKAIG